MSKDLVAPILVAGAIAVPVVWYAMHRWLEEVCPSHWRFLFRVYVGWYIDCSYRFAYHRFPYTESGSNESCGKLRSE